MILMELILGANDQGADAIQNRWLVIPRTLCFVFNGDDILLMKRAPTRRVFPNKYNGLGGHIESDEDPYSGAIREIKEESGLDVSGIQLCGVHNINAGQSSGIMIFVFSAWSTNREIVKMNDEGSLHWIPRREVLTLDLVEDLPYILPRLFAREDDDPPWFVHVSYDEKDMIKMQFPDV